MTLEPAKLRETLSVADGGWSTILWQRGLPAGRVVELANLEQPELIVALAGDYVAAGAEFITTNTFAANRFVFEKRKLDVDVAAVVEAGVQLARQAVGDRSVCVAGSIGPSGRILAMREVAEDDLLAAFQLQARVLAENGADAILLETFSEPAEILLALKAVKSACDLPVIASMSFDSGPQRTRTMMGARAEECAASLDDAGADIVGCNCGAGIEHVLPAVVALRAGTQLPLWVKPNAGMPDLQAGKAVYKQTPDEFLRQVPSLIEAGANIIGGCCGSTPEHIRRLARLIQARRQRSRR